MSKIDYHSEITLTVKQNGKTYEYYFPKVEKGELVIDAEYPPGYWDYPYTIKGIYACNVDLHFRAKANEKNIYATVKTEPPVSSRRHPSKKRTR